MRAMRLLEDDVEDAMGTRPGSAPGDGPPEGFGGAPAPGGMDDPMGGQGGMDDPMGGPPGGLPGGPGGMDDGLPGGPGGLDGEDGGEEEASDAKDLVRMATEKCFGSDAEEGEIEEIESRISVADSVELKRAWDAGDQGRMRAVLNGVLDDATEEEEEEKRDGEALEEHMIPGRGNVSSIADGGGAQQAPAPAGGAQGGDGDDGDDGEGDSGQDQGQEQDSGPQRQPHPSDRAKGGDDEEEDGEDGEEGKDGVNEGTGFLWRLLKCDT